MTPGQALDATFAALADPSRRGVVELLRAQPRRAGELADELRLSRPAMSRHLRVISHLRSWLEDVERFWTLELAAF